MTLTLLYRKTLENLRRVSAGDPADADDTTLVADKYVELYDMLAGESLTAWAVDADVPDYAAAPLTEMLSCLCAGSFGQDPTAYAVRGALGLSPPSWAERMLRRQLARTYISNTVQADYF